MYLTWIDYLQYKATFKAIANRFTAKAFVVFVLVVYARVVEVHIHIALIDEFLLVTTLGQHSNLR